MSFSSLYRWRYEFREARQLPQSHTAPTTRGFAHHSVLSSALGEGERVRQMRNDGSSGPAASRSPGEMPVPGALNPAAPQGWNCWATGKKKDEVRGQGSR